jgi:predicted GIY-YIG superfamily endonuclease
VVSAAAAAAGREFKSPHPDWMNEHTVYYTYVLRSLKTGKRYVGSCNDLEDRVRRHNAGHNKATKHGAP